jgi:hypothetical protein
MSAVDGWDKDKLATMIKGCYIPVKIDSIQDCPSYNCYIVNDLLLLSYMEARVLYSANKHRSKLYRILANRFVRWCAIKLYNVFLWTNSYPEYMIVPQVQPDPAHDQEDSDGEVSENGGAESGGSRDSANGADAANDNGKPRD